MPAGSDTRLALADKLFQESLWPQVKTVAAGGLLDAPLVVELDPTTYCDASCPECVSGRLLNQGGFTTERLLDLAAEMVDIGVRAVVLIGGGEPLLHPGTRRLLRLLGEAGLAIGVTTNGTQIHRCLDELAAHADWIRVSVDAGCEETYEVFRPHRSGRNLFPQIIDNMRALAPRRKGSLGYSFLLLSRAGTAGGPPSTNALDVFQAGVLAREIGCDYFEVKPSYDLKHFLLVQPGDIVHAAREQIERLRELETDDFQVIAPATLDVVLNGLPSIEPKDYDRCLVAELRTLITPRGAFVCPYFRGDPRRAYGNPVTQPLEQLWRGAQRRRVMAATRPSRDCRFHCIRHASNQALYAIGRGEPAPAITGDFDPFL